MHVCIVLLHHSVYYSLNFCPHVYNSLFEVLSLTINIYIEEFLLDHHRNQCALWNIVSHYTFRFGTLGSLPTVVSEKAGI